MEPKLSLLLPERPLVLASLTAASFLLICLLYAALRVLLRPALLSPLRSLPGPARASWLWGNVLDIRLAQPAALHTQWARQWGGIVRYHGLFGSDRLCVTDPAALTYMLLTRPYDFPKASDARARIGAILGKGVLFAEGEDHKRQRRVLQPAFSPSHLRDITPVFFQSADKLKERWMELLEKGATTDGRVFAREEDKARWKREKAEGEAVIDVSSWFSRATLDIIGQAGFGYDFRSLEGKETKLARVFSSAMWGSRARKPTPRAVAFHIVSQLISPWLPLEFIARHSSNKRLKQVMELLQTMEEESDKILEEKRRQVDREDRGAEKGPRSKDLIALLLRSQESDAKSRLSKAELQGQMTTMILAGHETTSAALSWLVWRLARDQAIQDRLRQELRSARHQLVSENRAELNSDELNALPYLDAVCRECLRLDAPIAVTGRTNSQDCILPLSKPITTKDGKILDHLPLKAGQAIFIPVAAVNRNPDIFGEDAEVFRPERWLDGSVGEGAGVGTWSPLLTFWAGARGCIGYRFAILELKALAAILVANFTFAEREPALEIEARAMLVSRSVVVGEEDLGFTMPLRVARAQ